MATGGMALFPRAAVAGVAAFAAMLIVVAAAPQRATPAAKSAFFSTSDGVRLHYLEQGDGPAVVFVPGWAMPARIWQSQLTALSRSYRVIAIDPRNQGESARTTEGNFPERRATDIHELVTQLHLEPVVLVGWSLGVRELVTYAKLFGTRSLRGLVLVDGEVVTVLSDERRHSQASFIHNVETRRADFTAEFVRGMFATQQASEYLSGLVRDALRVPTSAAVAMLADLYLENDMRADVAGIDVPVLVAVRTAHADQAAAVTAVLPSARTEIFDKAGHALFVDESGRFNALLEEFLASLRLP